MVLVAIEQGFPEAERIIIDPLAHPILPLSSRISVRLSLAVRNWLVAKTEQKLPGLWGGMMARKRYIDNIVTDAADGSLEGVVNLGAGFDTRAFRLPELSLFRYGRWTSLPISRPSATGCDRSSARCRHT